MIGLEHQLTLLRPRPKSGDPCVGVLCPGAYELAGKRLACGFCGFRPESVIVARWDPEARA